VSELLGHADVLILPLVEFKKPYRGMSSKLYEYQAAGKPIICCSRGYPEIMCRIHFCLVVRPGDFEALANAVLKLKGDSRTRLIMGESGRNMWSAKLP